VERWLQSRFPRARWETPGDCLGVLTHRVRFPGDGPGLPPGHLFLDLETLGFVGRPLFLIGLLHAEPDGIVPTDPGELDHPPAFDHSSGEARHLRDGLLVQILARDYAEEEEALRFFAREYASMPTWVTFNGKSFDVPTLHLRCAYYKLAKPRPKEHLDLLHSARRHFRGVFPDCRLKTLERRICGRMRPDDLDGSQVPDAYHRFVRDGDPTWLEPILRHNRDDLLTLAELFMALSDGDGS
jgi:uncharacterized protein